MCEYPFIRELANQVLHSLGLASRDLWSESLLVPDMGRNMVAILRRKEGYI